ncbi:hypothetical protein CMI37_25800 [Candidatus Pacearchaeota archaeon]|nr:hypothetical protein [Candidatus Pacearchaeota archaeon]|tara:strand:+ start:979 stop:1194 length:216 start_codon:yes stop_codon:yes gene_type:complete
MNKQLWYYDWSNPKRYGAILEEDLQYNIDNKLMTMDNMSIFDNEQDLKDLVERLREKFEILYNHYYDRKKD